MTHLVLLGSALAMAWILRAWLELVPTQNWSARWQRALLALLMPTLVIMMACLAVLWMGPYGRMACSWHGWLSYGLAWGFCLWAGLCLARMLYDDRKAQDRIRSCPPIALPGCPGRLLDIDPPFAAQVGIWQPQLVVSRGLLEGLDPEHLRAVLQHEQAHRHHRDTLWFFGLGWMRRCTAWLPNTPEIWRELLFLRELRADRWAAARVDPLTLAEALLWVVGTDTDPFWETTAALLTTPNQEGIRLEQRVEALLSEPGPESLASGWIWAWLGLTLLPLLSIPFHA